MLKLYIFISLIVVLILLALSGALDTRVRTLGVNHSKAIDRITWVVLLIFGSYAVIFIVAVLRELIKEL